MLRVWICCWRLSQFRHCTVAWMIRMSSATRKTAGSPPSAGDLSSGEDAHVRRCLTLLPDPVVSPLLRRIRAQRDLSFQGSNKTSKGPTDSNRSCGSAGCPPSTHTGKGVEYYTSAVRSYSCPCARLDVLCNQREQGLGDTRHPRSMACVVVTRIGSRLARSSNAWHRSSYPSRGCGTALCPPGPMILSKGTRCCCVLPRGCEQSGVSKAKDATHMCYSVCSDCPVQRSLRLLCRTRS